MNTPYFSVVIPVRDRTGELERALDSVAGQSWKDFEVIVVDDGSRTETCRTVEAICRSKRARLEKFASNRGVAGARNLGCRLSTGKWLAFLDSDDAWHSKKLERQFRFCLRRPDWRIHQTEEIWIRHGRRANPPKTHLKTEGDLFEACLRRCCVTPSSTVIRRDLFEECGGFDERLPACEDYDLWLSVASRNRIGLLREPLLTRYGGHADQLSSRYPAMDRFRVYSLLKGFVPGFFPEHRLASWFQSLRSRLKILRNGLRKRSLSYPPAIDDLLRSENPRAWFGFDFGFLADWLLRHENFAGEPCGKGRACETPRILPEAR